MVLTGLSLLHGLRPVKMEAHRPPGTPPECRKRRLPRRFLWPRRGGRGAQTFPKTRRFLLKNAPSRIDSPPKTAPAECDGTRHGRYRDFGYPWKAVIDSMIRITSRGGNESVEQMLRRFKKLCEKEGLVKDIKRSSYYEKPSERRRRRLRKAIKRALKLRASGP